MIIERFDGDGGRRALLDALKKNRLVEGDPDLATAIADTGALRQFKTGEVLIREGESDNAVYLIIAGSFSIYIKGNKIRERVPGEIVGETSAIDSSQRRSATLVASMDSVVVELTRDQFLDIADRFNHVWKSLAVELSRRFVQRNELIRHRPDGGFRLP
jgi:CRP/FNR family cyclic AMP-dependent transcriptional regulator